MPDNSNKPRILVTNDDGIHAAGLRALVQGVTPIGDVTVVAPSHERSASAQSLTLRQPIYCDQIAENEYSIEGTPADAVILAFHTLLKQKPDLVISGINRGGNMGENVYYSGTVGAAMEGAINNVPAPWTGEVRFTKQSSKITRNVLQPGSDPRGRRYFWLHEQKLVEGIEPDTDMAAIRDGAISITPLQLDHTHAPSLNHLSHWKKLLESSSKR